MTSLPPLQAGIYRHYKGQLYQVLGYAQDSTIDGRIVVVYVGLELAGATAGRPRMNVRSVEDFFGQAPNGNPRFEFVGAEWRPDQA